MLFLKQGFIILSLSAPKRSLVLIFYRVLQCMKKLLKSHFIKCCIKCRFKCCGFKNTYHEQWVFVLFFKWWAEYVMVRILYCVNVLLFFCSCKIISSNIEKFKTAFMFYSSGSQPYISTSHRQRYRKANVLSTELLYQHSSL